MNETAASKCEACAAVKRLKTSGSGAAAGGVWVTKPCECCKQVTQANAPAHQPPPAGMAAASPSDMLRPRRLFEDDEEDANEDVEVRKLFDDAVDATDPGQYPSGAGTAAATPGATAAAATTATASGDGEGGDDEVAGEAAAEDGTMPCSPFMRAPSPFMRSLSAPNVPGTPSPVFGSNTAVAFMGNYGRAWPLRCESPFPRCESPFAPPPPPLPNSSLDAAKWVNHSPGLMLAGARLEVGRRGAMTPASSTASSCATPSRAPLPMRPPTPGAPGSIRRSCSLFMDGVDGIDDLDTSPGATPERSATHGGPVAMSLTDTALLQLTQSMNQQLSIGPVGGKRSFGERDGTPGL